MVDDIGVNHRRFDVAIAQEFLDSADFIAIS